MLLRSFLHLHLLWYLHRPAYTVMYMDLFLHTWACQNEMFKASRQAESQGCCYEIECLRRSWSLTTASSRWSWTKPSRSTTSLSEVPQEEQRKDVLRCWLETKLSKRSWRRQGEVEARLWHQQVRGPGPHQQGQQWGSEDEALQELALAKSAVQVQCDHLSISLTQTKRALVEPNTEGWPMPRLGGHVLHDQAGVSPLWYFEIHSLSFVWAWKCRSLNTKGLLRRAKQKITEH